MVICGLVVSLEVRVINDEVIVLGYVLFETEMLGEECQQLVTRPVIRQLLRASFKYFVRIQAFYRKALARDRLFALTHARRNLARTVA